MKARRALILAALGPTAQKPCSLPAAILPAAQETGNTADLLSLPKICEDHTGQRQSASLSVRFRRKSLQAAYLNLSPDALPPNDDQV